MIQSPFGGQIELSLFFSYYNTIKSWAYAKAKKIKQNAISNKFFDTILRDVNFEFINIYVDGVCKIAQNCFYYDKVSNSMPFKVKEKKVY